MQTKLIPYSDKKTQLEGFAAIPSSERRPLVLYAIIGGGGMNSFAKKRN